MALTESHLDDTSKEAEYNITGYSHILCNRKDRQGGGVILYLRNNLTFKILTNTSDEMCSLLAITINELDLTVILVYRPPTRYEQGTDHNRHTIEQSFNNIIISNIDKVLSSLGTPTPNTLIMGDFNFPNATWKEGIAYPLKGTSPDTKMLNKLIETCETHQLLQYVPFGTRYTRNGGDNKLDLIFSNNHRLLCELRRLTTALSDHSLIECDLSYHTAYNPQNLEEPLEDAEKNLAIFNLHKADWKQIRKYIKSHQWVTLLANKSNKEKLQLIVAIVFEALDKFCPKFKTKRGQTKNKIPRDRRILFRQRKRINHKLKTKNPSPQQIHRLQMEIAQIERKLMASLHKECLLEEEKAIENIKENPKFFYTYARKRQSTKGNIGPLKVDGKLVTSPRQICESLSAQYSSVYSPTDPQNKIDDPQAFFNLDTDLESLQDIHFTEDMIEEEIGTIRNNSAAGPDHFPALLLKKCKKELKKPLYILWRTSLSDCDIAQVFKHAITCPVLKNYSESYLPKSYRPVSLTSHLIKTFEKIVAKAILSHLRKNKLLPWNQHGFLNERSTVSQLLSQTETILRYLEAGYCADTIYLDFAKAFDKVDHYLLCKKLKEKRIGGKVGAWLHNFLTNRTLQVSANGSLSASAPVLSGVPQGTVLGPILFIIMISDIDENLNHAFMSLFADDSRVTRKITNQEDCALLQKELDNVIYPWAESNNAVFNGDKFEHIHFGKRKNNCNNDWQYKDNNGNSIKSQTSVKDLGITITNDLSWTAQIENTISKCRRMSAWILRTFTKRDIATMRTLWTTMLRPLVDYCSPVWSPSPSRLGHIDRLEGILRGFSKHVDGLENLTYTKRLEALKLHSIQRRHERYKIIYLYKMKEKLVPPLPPDPLQPGVSFALEFKQTSRNGTRCNIPSPPRWKSKATIARKSSFAETASTLWNNLPSWLTSISGATVDAFKKNLDKHLDTLTDVPRCNSTGQYRDHAFRVSNSIIHVGKAEVDRHEVVQSCNGPGRATVLGQGRASTR